MIIVGDCIDVLKTIDAGSVQCCVTSPPYWGLRDYGVDGQLGSEATPELFVSKMVDVFREVKRVLRDDGTLWLNLGDSYSAGGRGGGGGKQDTNVGSVGLGALKCPDGYKPKNLVGIPWRVAFALQADGWYLRSDIIWAKPNPMPESCTDRPTKAHEYIFLLTKKARYFYDAEAVREKSTDPESLIGHTPRNAQQFEKEKYSETRSGFKNIPAGKTYPTRNARTVWTIATQPFSKAHFATFPEKLAEKCIKAGTSAKGCCPECGTAWVRVVEKDRQPTRPGIDNVNDTTGMANRDNGRHVTDVKTVGWMADCGCCLVDEPYKPIPCTVLDCFNGSGTTGVVAKQLGCDYIGIELNPEYAAMAEQRIANPYPHPEVKDVEGQLTLLDDRT